MGKSLLEELRRFFVGGGPQLEDITYSGIPADVKVCVSTPDVVYWSLCSLCLNVRVCVVMYTSLWSTLWGVLSMHTVGPLLQ